MEPFFVFVHLPKTGGTSIRHSAEAAFGPERMLYDYGTAARLTSDLVRDWIYDRKDPQGFAQAAREGGYRFLSGHFPLRKYREPFSGARFLTWMRHPAKRVWSSFRHYRRHHGFEGDFRAFYETPRFQNEQSRMMTPGPDCFQFIGVLERNSESLESLTHTLGLALPERRANRAPEADQHEPPTADDWRRVEALNADDMKTYEQALERYR